MKKRVLISSLIGIVCGFLSTHAFLIGWWNIIFWGLAGVGIGLFVNGKKKVMWTGLAYGFFLSVSFLFSGFSGTPDKLLIFTLFSIFLSIIGAFGGWFAVFLGCTLERSR